MADLDKLEPPHDEKKVAEALATLSKIARKIEERESSEIVDDVEMSNDFGDDADAVSEAPSAVDNDDDFDLD